MKDCYVMCFVFFSSCLSQWRGVIWQTSGYILFILSLVSIFELPCCKKSVTKAQFFIFKSPLWYCMECFIWFDIRHLILCELHGNISSVLIWIFLHFTNAPLIGWPRKNCRDNQITFLLLNSVKASTSCVGGAKAKLFHNSEVGKDPFA
jgi:hypothetical protein